MTVRKKQEYKVEMYEEEESNPLSRNRENDDGNIEGNEIKIQEAISSL